MSDDDRLQQAVDDVPQPAKRNWIGYLIIFVVVVLIGFLVEPFASSAMKGAISSYFSEVVNRLDSTCGAADTASS